MKKYIWLIQACLIAAVLCIIILAFKAETTETIVYMIVSFFVGWNVKKLIGYLSELKAHANK